MLRAIPLTAGLTAAACFTVQFSGGGSAFAKLGTDQRTAADIAAEVRFYQAVQARFLPGLIGYGDADGLGVLLLEDLSDARWPLPWPDDVTPLYVVLDEIAAVPPPPHLDAVAGRPGRWQAVAAAPGTLIADGFFTEAWLAECLPELVAAEEAAPLAGDHLVHGDLWYSNVCFTPTGARVVDWAVACIGSRWLDAATVTLEMRIAGIATKGPFPHEAEHAALLAGGFARQLVEGAPAGVDSERLDQELRVALGPALAWAAERLGLPAPPAR